MSHSETARSQVALNLTSALKVNHRTVRDHDGDTQQAGPRLFSTMQDYLSSCRVSATQEPSHGSRAVAVAPSDWLQHIDTAWLTGVIGSLQKCYMK